MFIQHEKGFLVKLMHAIEEFIKSTHVAVANRPEPYGLFHLVFVFASLAVMVAICYLTRKNSEKTFRIVMFSIGAALFLSEIYKQLYYLYAAGGEGYDWSVFPFQLCSVPMYLCMAVGCMKKNRVRDAMCEYLVSLGFLGGIMAYAEPSGILNPYYFTLIHSCIWHALLIFIALYILFTKNACSDIRGYIKAVVVLLCVVLTATALNLIFHDKQDFNMCYISPFYGTPLAVFKDFDIFFESFLGVYPGRIVSVLIYIVALVLGGGIIYVASWFVTNKLAGRGKCIPARD